MVAGVFLRHRCLAAQAMGNAVLEGGMPTNSLVLRHFFTGITTFILHLHQLLHDNTITLVTNPLPELHKTTITTNKPNSITHITMHHKPVIKK